MADQNCLYCQDVFSKNKYSPRQKVCSKTECQHKRQIDSMREWRQRHPSYFKYDETKGAEWLRTQRDRSKVWRQRNPDKIRNYRQSHIQEYRQYMRDYMRRYRERQKQLLETGEDKPIERLDQPSVQPRIEGIQQP